MASDQFTQHQPLIIGIIGRKGSGKDTMADRIIQISSPNTTIKYSLANPIKNACRDLFRLTDDQLYDETEKERPDHRWNHRSPRQLMQWLGTDVFREQFGTDFWLQHARWAIDDLARVYRVIIIPDIRFTNEASFVRSFKNHLLIRIHRDSGDGDPHTSETEMDTIPTDWVDTVIYNQSSLSKFYENIQNFVHEFYQLSPQKKDSLVYCKTDDTGTPNGIATSPNRQMD